MRIFTKKINDLIIIMVTMKIIFEEESCKVRNICIRREVLMDKYEYNMNISQLKEENNMICSFYATRSWGSEGLGNYKFRHLDSLMEN